MRPDAEPLSPPFSAGCSGGEGGGVTTLDPRCLRSGRGHSCPTVRPVEISGCTCLKALLHYPPTTTGARHPPTASPIQGPPTVLSLVSRENVSRISSYWCALMGDRALASPFCSPRTFHSSWLPSRPAQGTRGTGLTLVGAAAGSQSWRLPGSLGNALPGSPPRRTTKPPQCAHASQRTWPLPPHHLLGCYSASPVLSRGGVDPLPHP